MIDYTIEGCQSVKAERGLAERGFVNENLKKCKYDFKLVGGSGSHLDPPNDGGGNLRVKLNIKRALTTKIMINDN